MSTEIEETIYRLSLDGSAYIAGADSLSNSTKKLSDAQAAANAKLIELRKSQNNYQEAVKDLTVSIKLNEKEIDLLNAKLKALNATTDSGKKEAAALRKEIADITKGNLAYGEQLIKVKSQIVDTTAQIKLQAKEVQAAEKASAGFTQGLTKAYSGLRILANIIPGIGIGGLVALIAGPAVDALESWFSSLNNASSALKLLKENQKNLNEVTAAADKDAGKQIADLKILYETATNVNLSMKDRLAAVRALQIEFPDYFKNVSAETILNGEATKQYNDLATAILATARATAAKGKIDQLEAQQLDKDFERQKVINATNREQQSALKKNINVATATDEFGNAVGVITPAEQVKLIQNRRDARLKKIDEDKKDLQAQEDFLIKFAGLTNIAKVIEDKDDKKFKGTKTKEIDDDFQKRRNALREELAKFAELEFQDEVTIRALYAEKLKKALDDIKRDKGLKPGERKELNALTTELNNNELTKALNNNTEQRKAYQQKLNNDLAAIDSEADLKRISNIQDNFERQKQTIIAEGDKLLKAREELRDKEIAEIQKSKILKPAEKQKAISEVNSAIDELIAQVNAHISQQLQQLSFDTFEKLSEDLQRSLKDKNFDISALSLIDIQKQNELFQQGKISYKQYQEALTKIAKEESDKRREAEIANLRIEIGRRQAEIRNNKDLTDEQQQKILNEIRDKEGQVDTLQKGDKADAPTKKRVETVQQYAQAIGAVVDSVIAFWQKANQAEEAALDRSIALQERRVDAAQRIADRGNAQYLKAEEDRLTELNIKRENAARRQLGIDAALQASQILVGITGAIAKIATPGVGIAETIGAIAVIIGSLATGYALVKSLQGNQPKLAAGTTELKREGYPAGRDTIPAWLNEGEAVIPTEKNKKYKKSVEAIYHGRVPAEVLNEFVENYVKANKTESKKATTHEKFVENISQVPARVLNNFIRKEEKKYFTGTTEVKDTPALPVKAADFTETKEAIYSGKISTDRINNFAENYIKNKNLVSTVHDVLKDEKISTSFIKDVISKENKTENKALDKSEKIEDKKMSSVIQAVVKLAKERAENNLITSDVQNSLVNEHMTIDDVHKYSEEVNKVFERKQNIATYKTFVENIAKVPAKVINNFIDTYSQKFSKELSEKRFVETYNKANDTLNPPSNVAKSTPVINTISKEHLNNFVNNYHQIKSVPIPDYPRIKEAAELSIGQDGKMHVAITEQNKLIQENNDLQRATLRAMKNMSVSASIDRNGVAIAVNEYISQMEIDKRV